jgi:hypothetical protein
MRGRVGLLLQLLALLLAAAAADHSRTDPRAETNVHEDPNEDESEDDVGTWDFRGGVAMLAKRHLDFEDPDASDVEAFLYAMPDMTRRWVPRTPWGSVMEALRHFPLGLSSLAARASRRGRTKRKLVPALVGKLLTWLAQKVKQAVQGHGRM